MSTVAHNQVISEAVLLLISLEASMYYCRARLLSLFSTCANAISLWPVLHVSVVLQTNSVVCIAVLYSTISLSCLITNKNNPKGH